VTDGRPEPSLADPAQHTVDRQLVLAALWTLSSQHRHVLFECHDRGLSVDGAAATLGVPPGTRNPAPTRRFTPLLHAIGQREAWRDDARPSRLIARCLHSEDSGV
jgi:DNA-directed RNA polymerase specialized sigma24 family protein